MKSIIRQLSVFSLILILASGCIFSLHPLYSTDVAIRNDKLIGNWHDVGANKYWKFEVNEAGNYSLVFSNQKVADKFEVVLLELEGIQYLDIFPNDPDIESELLAMTLIPAHIFYKVNVLDDRIELNSFDYDWMSKILEESRIRLPHEKTTDGYVLTASTKELQQFVSKYGHLTEAYEENTIVLKKLN